MLTLHLAALATYVASCLYVLLVLLPCAVAFRRAESRRRFLARSFRLQNPIAIGSLGVIVMTGAFAITEAKARLGTLFFVSLARPLAIKLALTFIVINIATYVGFGITHRIVRAHQAGLAPNAARLASAVRRVRVATTVALALTGLAAWLATEMEPLLYPRASPSACRDQMREVTELSAVLAKCPPYLSS